ncbi:hypothetical protein ASPZODRAFT_166097 [Penicilliopsis zonata CBS 506.65]|uniref:Rhodopsin domain-containing protein n=1 Tax=Penicilliopsis zonata CBS 506.65 TaxID=1073090 RepID=A0A1L9SLE7_9EURO|nr:hypothetical protein ASPZODRAFT_166097 [Penicilliopsis zonata CBS 506.65]OJJ48039.1 hypothetical protein ASPZODRAFT_166097 [Penicilliopsis zonata CBS 506.65]
MVDDSHQRTALAVVVAFTLLGGASVLLRVWSKRLTRAALRADDYLILAGYVMSIAQCVSSWYYIKTNYVGIHIWDVPTDYNVEPGLIWNFVNQLFYNPCLTLVKLSMLVFLLRLESRSRIVHSLILFSSAVTIGLFLAVLVTDIFQCHPVRYVFDESIAGSCIDQGVFYVATAALNLFTDLLVLSIPIIITVSLQMPVRRKIAVCAILCLGIVATAVGIWRVIILAEGFLSNATDSDPTYSIGFCSSAVEINVAILTACAPSMKAVASRYLPRLLGSSSGPSRYPTSAAYGYGSKLASRSHHTPGDAFELNEVEGSHGTSDQNKTQYAEGSTESLV